MARDHDAQAKAKAHSVFIRLALPPYTVHFKSPSYMKDATLDMLDKKVVKEVLKGTASQGTIRRAIGTDEKFWADICTLLKAAIPSLERRSFTIWDPSSVDYESTSGALIASHYPGLWKDLERLNDLMSVGRNILEVGDAVQDLAAAHHLDMQVFRLINCCVRVTARGYDGDAGTGDEEKWQWIVNGYKKLLITSLQFLNNMVAQNEKRKLILWTLLFDGTGDNPLHPDDVPETSSSSLTDVPSNPTSKPNPPVTRYDKLIAFGTEGVEKVDIKNCVPLWDDTPFSDHPLPKEAIEGLKKGQANGYVLYVKRATKFCIQDYNTERRRDPTTGEIHQDMPRRWSELHDEDHDYWQRLYDDAMTKYRQDVAVYQAKMLALTEQQPMLRSDVPMEEQTKHVEQKIAMIEEQLSSKLGLEDPMNSYFDGQSPSQDGPLTMSHKLLQPQSVAAEDMRMIFTADAGTKILESGKAELMKRLEGYEPDPVENVTGLNSEVVQQTSRDGNSNPGDLARNRGHSPLATYDHPSEQMNPTNDDTAEQSADDEDEEELEEMSEDDVEDDEEDYPGSTEDGRGLLTDVPLILGPSEIEVLPMLIMSGIVPNTDQAVGLSAPDKNFLLNIHLVRTHLLLAQSNGRNLLRELLIFVAAWDLREEELYFKFMVKIMEAILSNGLMPYAYHAFRDRSRSKDIISPAQAVIMKLLTCIFRARGETAKKAAAENAPSKTKPSAAETPALSIDRPAVLPNSPSRVDLHILNFIFTEFRQHIIPQTCALIFLQGQIHAGKASPEDFPLNLWDMERMYEGVYQYLEFFAVLTEEGAWKGILGEWEMASELVTLLRELEGGIPKTGGTIPQVPKRTPGQPSDAITGALGAAPVAVERPFDVAASDSDPTLPPLPLHPNTNPSTEAETPLAYPEDPALPLAHDIQHEDEPSDFEWRNLKKLTVLVLSSLLWKNRMAQDQVRRYGGLEALVRCCKADEHNPYIREHAIMCLRFAVEGCEENARVIRKMAAAQNQKPIEGGRTSHAPSEDIPREVLDNNGYETFMDPKGQVGLRLKDGGSAHNSNTTTNSSTSTSHAHVIASSASGPSNAGVSKPRINTSKMTPEKAAELMSNALKELPVGEKFVTDKEKAEALAKLDKAFESTERVLGRGVGKKG